MQIDWQGECEAPVGLCAFLLPHAVGILGTPNFPEWSLLTKEKVRSILEAPAPQIVSHRLDDGSEHPVAFASQTLPLLKNSTLSWIRRALQ